MYKRTNKIALAEALFDVKTMNAGALSGPSFGMTPDNPRHLG